MPAYMIIQSKVHDPDAMERYREAVRPLIAEHGGKSVVRGGPIEVLEGAGPRGRLSVIEFPTIDDIHAFWASPAYQPVKALREQAAELDVWIVPTAA